MEKSRTASTNFRVRLLVLLLIYIFFNYSSWAQGTELRFVAKDEYYFTTSDGAFELTVPNVKPENIQISASEFGKDISLVSLKKENLNLKDTRVSLKLKFNTAREYKISPVKVYIKGRLHNIPVDSVTVYENPRTTSPQVFLRIDSIDGIKADDDFLKEKKLTALAGQEIIFTVGIRYAVQVLSVNYTLPENSIFKEISHPSGLENLSSSRVFTPEVFPVCSYSWTPIEKGEYSFPSVYILSTSYSGIKSEATFSEQIISIGETSSISGVQKKESAFSYAFTSSSDEITEAKTQTLSKEEVIFLSELYKKERHSFPFISKASVERRNFEKEHSIVDSPVTPNIPFLYILIIICVMCFALAVLFFILRKKINATASLVSCIVFLLLSILYSSYTSRQFAIYEGGVLNTIPEENMQSGLTINAGSKILIENSPGQWSYIHYSDISGWVKSEKLHFIY